MRILHTIISLDPAQGGPPRVVTRMAAAQALLGHEVRILSYAFGTSKFPDAVNEMTATIPGFDRVHVDYLEWGGRKEALLASDAKSWLQKRVGEADVVHIHNVWESLNRAAAAEARRQGRPYFIQPNGMLDTYSMQSKRLKKRLALMVAYRRVIDGAAGLLLGNEDERGPVASLGFKAPLFLVPLNGVFVEELANLPPPGEFYKRYPQLNRKPFIVFLGRLHYKKGLDYLGDAFGMFAKKNPDVHLVVVGHDEGAKADFEQRIAAAGEAVPGIRGRVHLVGPLHGKVKWEAFRDASCFALPSRQEGFSIAITEALACGLPVVVTRECHFPEVASAGAGVVTELDARDVARAFETVFASEDRRRQMSAAARGLVETKYNCLSAARLLIEIYQQALDGSRSTQPARVSA